VIYDPQELLKAGPLRFFVLEEGNYRVREELWLSEVGLGLKLWHGRFEGKEAVWLRWCDRNGNVLPTGAERADQERLRGDQALQQAEEERLRAEQAQQHAQEERLRAEQAQQHAQQSEQQAQQERMRAERLAEQLRALGVDPSA
jgi:hypothetical protein